MAVSSRGRRGVRADTIRRRGLPGANIGQAKGTGHKMGRIVKLIMVLGLLAFGGLTGYAYLADLSPGQAPVSVPVTLNAD